MSSTFGTDQGTLNEPVLQTILRDVKRVGFKLRAVLIPGGRGVPVLKDWDLWGPLILCLTLATLLQSGAPPAQAPLVFATVFVIVWCGAGVVTINALLLGGTISFFQSVCVLGYCMFPLVLASIFSFLFHTIFIKLAVTLACFFWATTASIGFVGEVVPAQRKLLATYPVALFYLCISWMVLIQ